MNKTKIYKVDKIWLSLIAVLGTFLVGISIFYLVSREIFTSNILIGIMGVILLYQVWSFNRSGYLTIRDQQLSINLGIRKKQIKISEIKEIKHSRKAYKLLLMNGRKAHIAMNFVSAKDRTKLSQDLEKIKTLQR